MMMASGLRISCAMPAGELADRRHLLGLDELILEALAIRHVDADLLDEALLAVLDHARS